MSTDGTTNNNIIIVECPLCGYFPPNLTLHISHLRLVHSGDLSFNIVCGIRGCTETFRAFSAYNSHVYRRHRDALGLETFLDSDDMIPGSSIGEEDTPTSVNAAIINDDDEAVTSVHEVAPVLTVPMSDSGPISQSTRAAKFLLQLREGRRVSEVALTDVIDTCNVMCTQLVNDLKQEIREKYVQANVDIASIKGLAKQTTPTSF